VAPIEGGTIQRCRVIAPRRADGWSPDQARVEQRRGPTISDQERVSGRPEHGYAMCTSPLGTWIPFGSIWLVSFLVGQVSRRQRQVAHVAW